MAGLERDHLKGVLVEATDIEGQMHFSHYLSRGFEIVNEAGHHKLLYLPIANKQVTFHRRQANLQPRRGLPVEIHLFQGFLCPYQVSTHILVREIALEFGDQVSIQEVWLTSETLDKYGLASGVLINGQPKLAGGETERAVRQAILEEL